MNKTMVKVKAHVKITGEAVQRGVVRGFSGESRKRMFDMLHEIDESNPLPLFVTLTYGQAFPSCREAYGHLLAFVKRLDVFHGRKVGVVWRGELQERGAPHFHLLCFCPFTPKEWVTEAWGGVVPVEYHNRESKDGVAAPFCTVEAIRSWRGVKWYVGKYMGKTGSGTARRSLSEPDVSASLSLSLLHNMRDTATLTRAYEGRAWGVINRSSIKWDRLTNYGTLQGDKGEGVARLVRQLGKLEDARQSVGGVTLYLNEGMQGLLPAIERAWKEQGGDSDNTPF